MAKDGTVINTAVADIRAKSFLHAISEIQQFSAIEYRTNLPEGVVPLIPFFSFTDVAFKTAIAGTIYTFAATPFSIAVFEKILPIFNSTSPTFMDKLFSCLLSCAPVLATSFLLIAVLVTRFYMGKTTKKIASNFIMTFVGTKIGISFILAMIFLFIYSSIFTEQFIVKNFSGLIASKMTPDFLKMYLYKFAIWLIDFRNTIPQAVRFSVCLHIGTSILIGLAFAYTSRRNRKIEEFRKEWE